MTYKQKNTLRPYVLLLPAYIAILGVIAFPIFRALVMSFQSYSLLKPNDIKFIAFGNYYKALQDPVFWSSLVKTGVYVFGTVLFQFLFGLIFALMLNSTSFISRVSRNLILIPWVIPGVLAAFMWRWLFNANYGLFNTILKSMGLINENIAWLTLPDTAMFAVIVASIWKGVPFFTLMLLAGLQSVPKELYEASKIDGASKWQQLFSITIPSIMPTIVTTTLLRIIWTANFVDIIFNMTEGGPGYSTQVLSVYTFMTARSTLNYGYSASLSIFMTILLIVVIMIYVSRARKEEII
ncbi:carbohydrate ABC transporter permease [Pleomorphochaeta sp. DL1XJH-081]|uniref:carbohydrate ABC transporter permease n=1 Tax=Pleomorphochaeta sp. DL1XJH-081 TaxID=3409690 RepID=UPI003BB5F342